MFYLLLSTDYEISFLNKLGIFVCSIITFVAQGQINNLSEKQLNTKDLINTKALNVIVLLVLSFFMILKIYNNSIPTSQK